MSEERTTYILRAHPVRGHNQRGRAGILWPRDQSFGIVVVDKPRRAAGSDPTKMEQPIEVSPSEFAELKGDPEHIRISATSDARAEALDEARADLLRIREELLAAERANAAMAERLTFVEREASAAAERARLEVDQLRKALDEAERRLATQAELLAATNKDPKADAKPKPRGQ